MVEGIIHYASRGALDIRGLGDQRVIQLHELGLVENVGDLYELTTERLEPLDGFATKAAQQLVDAIETSKGQPLSKLLFALGIRHVGAGGAKLLARRFGSLDELMVADEEVVAGIDGIGPTIAEAAVHFFAEPQTRVLIDRLRQHGVTFEEPTAESSASLAGQTYVLSGTLPTLSRSEATRLIEEAGASVKSSVSKNTTALVAGESPGSKLERARQLNVTILDENTLLRRLRDGA